MDKTEIYFNKDQNNIAPNNLTLNVWGISQSIQFPTVYGAQRKMLRNQAQLNADQFAMDKQTLTKNVYQAYNEVVYWNQMLDNYTYLDSLYSEFEIAANRRFELGETNYLEKLTAETKKKEISIRLTQIEEGVQQAYISLHQYLQSDSVFEVSLSEQERILLLPLDTTNHAGMNYFYDATRLAQQVLILEKQKLLPDLNVAVFRGTNNGPDVHVYSGFQVGVGIPLYFGSQKSHINAAKTETMIVENEKDNYKIQLEARYHELQSNLKQLEQELTYYEATGKKHSEDIVFHARQAFINGEIDFLQYTQLLENAKSIELNYLTALFQYNQTVLEANYLIN